MRTRLAILADELRTGYWFVPTLLALAAILLAFVLVGVDQSLRGDMSSLPGWLDIGGHESARLLLSTAAGAMVTVAGVTFSIAIVAITVATAQFGPRLLRNFLQDRGSQLSLGTFLATFLYCLLVLRTVRSPDEGLFVPHVATTAALVLTVVSIIVLIYFIHHALTSIQIARIIDAAADDLERVSRAIYPSSVGAEPPEGTSTPPAGGWAPLPSRHRRSRATEEGDVRAPGEPILATRDGYVEAIDGDGLLAAAVAAEVVVHVLVRPGSWVEPGVVLATVDPPERRALVEPRVRRAMFLTRHRTERQDIEFALQQIVQINVRALSAAYNDPYTGMMCLDRLAYALSGLAERPWPSPARFDRAGQLRLILDTPTFPVLLSQAMTETRRSGRTSLAVMVRMLEALELIAMHAVRDEDRAAIRRQAERVLEATQTTLELPHERALLTDKLRAVETALSPR